MTDYYATLNITRTASQNDIKKAYKKLAMKWHPDRNSDPGALVQFQQINEAYNTLVDTNKRSAYDAMQRNPDPASHFKDVYNTFRNRSHTKAASRVPVSINLEQAFTGLTVRNDRFPYDLNLPAGVRNNSKFILSNNHITVTVRPHHKFKRSNDDLLVEASITAIEAMIGIKASITMLDGSALKFDIAAGIQPGQIIKLASRGMPNPEISNRRGDLLIRVNITIPDLTSDSKQAIIHLLNRNLISL